MLNSTIMLDLHHLALSICHALLHSLWLGVVAAVLAGLVIAVTTRSNPTIRYYLLVSILGLFMLASVVSFFSSYNQQSELGQGPETIAHLDNKIDLVPVHAAQIPTLSIWQKLQYNINAYSNWIVLCWLVIVLWKAFRLIAGMRGLQQCRIQGTQSPAEEWVARVQELTQQLQITRVVKVLESALVKVPCTIGYFKPVILVPLGMFTLLPPAQVESILLHELAHIKRKDFVVNIMLECIEAVFFFNPAIRWLLSVIRQEREVCCDATVTAFNGQPKPYMEALVSFQEQFNKLAYTMPLTGRHSLLLDRIKRIINKRNKNLTSMEKVVLSLSIVAVVSFSFLPASSVKKGATKMESEPVATHTIKETPFKMPVVATSSNPVVNLAGKDIPVIADTTGKPNQKDSITGVHQYTMASPTKRTDYTEITTASGNQYKIAKEKGVIVGFSINGVERDVKEATRFGPMIKNIEAKTALAEKDRQKMEHERSQAEQRRKEIEARATALEKERAILEEKREAAQERSEEAEEEADQRRKEVEQKRMDIEQKRIEFKQREMERQQRRIEAEQKRQMSISNREHDFRVHDSLATIQKQKVIDIIQYLVKTGVAPSPESVQSFALTRDALLVNGEQQDAQLHQQLAKAYGIQSDLGLYYGSVSGPAKGYFFGKHEINFSK